MARTVAVIGAGVSGLTVAYELQQYSRNPPDGVQAICLEATGRAGGNIQTHKEAGYTCEWGPNGYLDNVPATPALVRRLGLSEQLQQADEQAAIRYIYRAGALREAPTGAGAFLKSGILSPLGKLRLLWEPLAGKRPLEGDESVFDFAARRIGPEAAEVLVGAMVNGVYAGNVRELCLKSTFPKMYAMETDHGSLFRAMLAKKKSRSGQRDNAGPAGPGGVLTSFRPGLEELIRGLEVLDRGLPMELPARLAEAAIVVLSAEGMQDTDWMSDLNGCWRYGFSDRLTLAAGIDLLVDYHESCAATVGLPWAEASQLQAAARQRVMEGGNPLASCHAVPVAERARRCALSYLRLLRADVAHRLGHDLRVLDPMTAKPLQVCEREDGVHFISAIRRQDRPLERVAPLLALSPPNEPR